MKEKIQELINIYEHDSISMGDRFEYFKDLENLQMQIFYGGRHFELTKVIDHLKDLIKDL